MGRILNCFRLVIRNSVYVLCVLFYKVMMLWSHVHISILWTHYTKLGEFCFTMIRRADIEGRAGFGGGGGCCILNVSWVSVFSMTPMLIFYEI